jgi:hypothetical protein
MTGLLWKVPQSSKRMIYNQIYPFGCHRYHGSLGKRAREDKYFSAHHKLGQVFKT